MRSSKILRCCSMAFVAVASFGVISVAAAQDTTPEPTDDMMMSEMMSMDGACPQGWAATKLEEMGMDMGMTDMDMTEEPMDMAMTEEPMMEATMDMDMNMTEEPMMEATQDMDMTDEASMGVGCFIAELDGANEVPGPGDEDGYGVALVTIDPSTNEVCYEVAVANLTLPAAAMHIHVNSAGVAGDVVVPFPTAPDAEGMASGCTTADTEGLLEAISTTPAGYYVNVHTSDFAAGAVRGQLMSWADYEMMEGSNMGDMSGDMGSMEMTPEATASS